VDSGAEKDVIRKASSYLDFLIVHIIRCIANLFVFSEQFKALNFRNVQQVGYMKNKIQEKTG
jgi:hypothetical protein